MGGSEYPLARAERVRGQRRPAGGAWLAICIGAALLLPGASDGPGTPAPAAAEPRIALPVDRVLQAGTEILGGGEAPDVWSTPLRLELADETAKSAPAEPTKSAAAAQADLRFSLVNLTDLAPLRPAADLWAADLPAADAPAPDAQAADAPATATASVSDPPPDPATMPVDAEAVAPRASDVRPAAATPATPARPAITARILGRWAPEAEACQNRNTGYLPMTIGPKGAKAGAATCRFGAVRPSGPGWAIVASCASGRERWTSNVTLTLVGNRLTWSSERGTQTYQRCG